MTRKKQKLSYKKPDFHPYIDDWMSKVETGKVESCEEQKLLMALLRKVLSKKTVYIDSDEILDSVEMMERRFFALHDFQRFMTALIVGVRYKQDDTLVFNQVFIMGGRGFGKNGFISALTTYLTSGGNGIERYNVDIVATAEDQAKTSFDDIYNMVEENEDIEELFHRTKIEIENLETKSKIRYRTSNAKTKDGLRPGCVIFDEVHEYTDYKNINVYTSALGKTKDPRRIYLTTDGYVRDAVLDDLKEKAKQILNGEIEHNGFLPILFKLDDISEVEDKKKWIKANPRLSHAPELMREMEIQYRDMLLNDEVKEEFITKRMNLIYVSADKVVAVWKDIMTACKQKMPDLSGASCLGVLDYADVNDFVSVGLYFKHGDKRVFKQHSFIHEKSIRMKKYNVNLKEAFDKGWATLVKGTPTIPGTLITNWFLAQAEEYNIKKVIGDRYRISGVSQDFANAGIPFEGKIFGPRTHMQIQPFVNKLFTEHLLILEDDKLMRWYINNVGVRTDSKGNKEFFKIEQKRRKTDGMFALLHGIASDDDADDVTAVHEVFEPFVF
ncbi:MAG: terminase large subunit [Peptostreptococcaceae bacterium]|nr:terminase large subunit [Peptostreptococcaceae bacterium]